MSTITRRDWLKVAAAASLVTAVSKAQSVSVGSSDQLELGAPVAKLQERIQKILKQIDDQDFDEDIAKECFADGKLPLYARTDEWKNILESLYTDFGLIDRDGSVRTFNAFLEKNASPGGVPFLSIDHAFICQRQFQETPLGCTLSEEGDPAVQRFDPFHVEWWLNDAAELLDRALRLRTEWSEMSVKAFNIAVELTGYALLDQIHEEEIKNGFYTNSVEFQSLGAISAESAVKDGYDVVEKNLVNEKTYATTNAQKASIDTEVYRNSALRDASSRKIQAGIGMLEWDEMDIFFRRARTDVSRRLSDLKVKATTKSGAVLNYLERMKPLKARFQRDFEDALARVFVASTGLSQLYGYDIPLQPDVLRTIRGGENASDGCLDDAVIWLRGAIGWLRNFSSRDQSHVLAVSLRKMLSEDQWKKGISQRAWTFEISEDLFERQRHVRLRGANVFVVGPINEGNAQPMGGVWRVVLQPPKNSYCRHERSDKKQDLVQTSILPCILGRVTTREALKEADTAGTSAWLNASPFGIWRIELSAESTAGVSVEGLDDINIDLAVNSKMVDVA